VAAEFVAGDLRRHGSRRLDDTLPAEAEVRCALALH